MAAALQGVWDFSYEHGSFEVAFLASGTFYCKDYLRKASFSVQDGVVLVDWASCGHYTLTVGGDGKSMAGHATNNSASWRKATLKRALSDEEVKAMEAAVAGYVAPVHVHSASCGH